MARVRGGKETSTWTLSADRKTLTVVAVGTDPTGQYIVFDENSDLAFIAFPVTPDHYSTSFGPGITAQGTVVLMH